MAKSERLVTFTLLGQEYSFYTGATEEEMDRVLSMVRSLVEPENETPVSGTLPVSKIAILACLNIASRYIQLEKDFNEYRQKCNSRATSLIEDIEICLSPQQKKDDDV